MNFQDPSRQRPVAGATEREREREREKRRGRIEGQKRKEMVSRLRLSWAAMRELPARCLKLKQGRQGKGLRAYTYTPVGQREVNQYGAAQRFFKMQIFPYSFLLPPVQLLDDVTHREKNLTLHSFLICPCLVSPSFQLHLHPRPAPLYPLFRGYIASAGSI